MIKKGIQGLLIVFMFVLQASFLINVKNASAADETSFSVFCVEDYNSDTLVKVNLTGNDKKEVSGLSFDYKEKTLTFNNYNGGPVYVGYDIRNDEDKSLQDITVKVIGDNTIHSMKNASKYDVNATFALVCLNATITGNGSLTVESAYKEGDGYDLDTRGNLTIDGPTINISDTSDSINVNQESVFMGTDFKDLGGELNIKSGKFNLSLRPKYDGKDYYYVNNAAVYADKSINITGGEFRIQMGWTTETTPKIPFGVFYAKNQITASSATIITTEDKNMGEVTAFFVPKSVSTLDNNTDKISVDSSVNLYVGSPLVDISKVNATISNDNYTYSGQEYKPVVIIKGLIDGTDYSVSYKNNKSIGTATAVITGKGMFSGTKNISFNILAPKVNTILKVGKFKYRITKRAGYKVTGEVAVISPINKALTSASLPMRISNAGVKYNVTAINNNAFKNCKKLRTLIISKNIKKLGNNILYGCSKLKSIKIKSSKLTEKSISKKAFKGVKKGVTIRVPKKKKITYVKIFKKKGLSKKVKIV